MKPKMINILVQTLLKFASLIISFSSCPQATNKKFIRAYFRLNTRWRHLDLVLRRISDDIELLKKALKGPVDQPYLFHELLIAAPSLDIETFYVVVRSLLDDIAILTPFFYPKGKMRPKSTSFKDQLKWYKSHPDFDPPMTNYFGTKLGWFDELKGVRDDLLHRQCDVLPINSPTGSEHKSIPIRFDIIDDYGMKLGQPELEIKVRKILQDLLEFLNFYSSHFKDRIPNDWPCYRDFGGRQPEGSVHGLEFLKRWVG